MGKAWIRQEVKRDRFVETVDHALVLAKNHPQQTAGIGLGSLAVVALAVFSVARYYETRTKAWEDLAGAEKALRTDQGQPLKELDDLRSRYPSAPAADYAGLLKGDVLYAAGKYDDASQAYRDTLDRARKDARPFAMLDLALSQESGGKLDDALTTLGNFLSEYPEHILAPEARFAQAECYDAQEKKDLAKSAYEKISLLYPDTDWAKTAQERLGIKPQQPNASTAPGGQPGQTVNVAPPTSVWHPIDWSRFAQQPRPGAAQIQPRSIPVQLPARPAVQTPAPSQAAPPPAPASK